MKQFQKTILILFILFTTGCYYDNEEKLYSEVSNSCNLENVTYTATTKPILQASCYSCHSNSKASNSGGGVKLENYADVKIYVNNGKLMGSIRHEKGYIAMPDGGGKLTDCEISQLQTWIDNGTLNN